MYEFLLEYFDDGKLMINNYTDVFIKKTFGKEIDLYLDKNGYYVLAGDEEVDGGGGEAIKTNVKSDADKATANAEEKIIELAGFDDDTDTEDLI